MLCRVLLFAVVVLLASASYATADAPFGWLPLNSAARTVSGDEQLILTFFLRNSNLAELEQFFWAVSDPRSALYTKYMTQSELAALVAPPSSFLSAFADWIETASPVSIDSVAYQDVVRVRLSARDAEQLLNVRFERFEHVTSGVVLIRSTQPATLPEHIKAGVDLIVGVNDFPPPHSSSSSRSHSRSHSQSRASASSSSRAFGSNGTKITELSGRDQQVTIDFQSAFANASELAVFGNVYSDIPTYNFRQSFGGAPTCQQGPDKSGVLSCSFSIDNLPNYVPLRVELSETYGSATPAATVVSDYPCTPTPNALPQMVRTLYNIPQGLKVTNAGATQSVVEFEQQYYSPKDLDQFFELTGTAACPVTLVGPNDASNPGAEAALDIEWMCALGVAAPSYFWSIGANSTLEIDHILTWLYQMGNTTNPPVVNSLSYGMAYQNVDLFLGQGYADRTDVELQKLAARGITAIVASGDTGANDIGPLPMSVPVCGLHADWPSQSPFITSVGSTFATPLTDPFCYVQGGPDCLENTIGEVGISVDAGFRWTSGGGFAITPRPTYQDDLVLAYLKNTDALPAGFASNPLAQGRAYPDAAMLGNDLQCVVAGEFVPVSGTSASAPIFAGVITLLNNDRLNAGKMQLGFLNQMMYQAAVQSAFFNDVVVGNNACGAYGFDPVCCPLGYSAAVGFDSVAGLGSINYIAARDYVLSLP